MSREETEAKQMAEQPATAMTTQMVALDTSFTDSQDRRYNMRELITKPTLLLPVYYYCPKTCTFDLDNLASDYQVIFPK